MSKAKETQSSNNYYKTNLLVHCCEGLIHAVQRADQFQLEVIQARYCSSNCIGRYDATSVRLQMPIHTVSSTP